MKDTNFHTSKVRKLMKREFPFNRALRHRNPFTNIIFIIIIICYSSCRNQKIPEMYIKAAVTMDRLNDSSYLSDVRSIYFDKYLYITDYDRDQILILNGEGGLLKTLGSKGKGPGEFLGAAHVFVYNDTIIVFNDGKSSFDFFDFDNHLKTVRLPESYSYSSSFRFFFRKGRLFLSSVSDSNSIFSFDINTLSSEHFGDLFLFTNPTQTRIRNSRHLFGTENYILAVSDNMPIVEKYDYSGNKLETLNYSRIPLVRKRIEEIRSKIQTPNSYGNLLHDAYLEKNKLYLLLYTNKEKISCNDVMVIDLSKQKMYCKEIINLGYGWYNSICISNDILYAFGKDGLEIFRLRE